MTEPTRTLELELELEESIPTVGSNGESEDWTFRFRYGWRYVRRVSNGEEEWERVPLTEEDVLHPQMEDYVMQSDGHYRICHYLYAVLRARMQRIPGGLVLHDVGVEWGVPGMKGHAPDLVVFAEAWDPPRSGVFDLKERSGRVLLIIEVTSPATRHLDVASLHTAAKTRFRHYAQVGVPYYILIDEARRPRGEVPPALLGYELTEDGYRPLPLNEQGRLWVPTVGMWLGPSGTEMVWFDENGQRIWHYEEEQAARLAAEERVRELERKLQELQGT
jgi:colicin import membrane protein